MDAPAPPRSPPPWPVPWEGAGPVPRVPALAAPLLARREAQRLLLELRRARPLPGLNHVKRLRGGPGRAAAVLLCLESDVPPPAEWEAPEGDGATNDTSDVTSDIISATDDITHTASNVTRATSDVTNDTSVVTKDISDVTSDVTSAPSDVTDATGDASVVTKDTSDVTSITSDVTSTPSDVTNATAATDDITGIPSDVTGATDDASLPPLPPLRVLLGPTVSPRGLGPPFRVLIPGRAPQPGPETSAALAAGLWPWVLRGPRSPPPAPSHQPLQPSELPAVAAAMAAAVAAAQSGARAGMVPAGAAVLDPGTGRVVAAACDGRRGGHPLGHATMRCLEAVARCRRGNGGGDGGNGGGNGGDGGDGGNGGGNGGANGGDGGDGGGNGGYLCQGWDVVLTREPCALCAMALVLARARRVLFGAPVPQGALSTRYGLHGRARLNHRYRAYGGVAARVWAPLGGGHR